MTPPITKPPQIVAMGGGGFSEEPGNPLLDDFILALSGAERPRVCFLPTASGDAQGYIEKFHDSFGPDRAEACHLTLFRDPGVSDLTAFVLDQDVVYVGGGSTVNMLAVWRVHGLDRALCEAWKAGVILAGISAGMVCWFEACLTDSLGGLSPLNDGLALLPGSACPHFDGESERRTTYHRCIAEESLPGGIAADEGAAAHYIGTKLQEAVSSRPNARAYEVAVEGGLVKERPIGTRYLGA